MATTGTRTTRRAGTRKRTGNDTAETKPTTRRSAVKKPATSAAPTGAGSPTKRTAKPAAAKSTAKRAPRKRLAPAPEAARYSLKDTDVFGFARNTDISVVVEELVRGGETRAEIIDRIRERIPSTTRTGGTKNVPSMVSLWIKRLLEKGYTVEASYKLVPPEDVRKRMSRARAAETRKARRGSK